MLVVKKSSFAQRDQIFPIFLNSNLRRPTAMKMVQINIFNSFGSIKLALIMIPLCLFSAYIFYLKTTLCLLI